MTILSQQLFAQHKVTFKLTLPEKYKFITSTYFLALEQNNWKTGDTAYMFKKVNGVYSLSFNYDGKYFLQYKVNRGNNNSYESDSEGFGIPNRMLNVLSDTVANIDVDGWTDLIKRKHTASNNVKILFDSLFVKSLNTKKQVSVYLPRSYLKSKKKYPVIYMNDGQVLFDRAYTDDGHEWKLDEVMDTLNTINKGEFIVIGISSGGNRFPEYSPYETNKLKTPKGRIYLSFIIDELMPYINKTFRTKRGPEKTSIGGSSMGGLISYFAAIEYPNIFGSAAVFSPAYWNSISVDSLKKETVNKTGSIKSKIFLYGGRSEGVEDLPSTLIELQQILNKNPIIKTKLIINNAGKHEDKYWTQPFKEFVLWLQEK
ncbi:MAG: alpha/beta hydrolase [Chitinophagaceae bacterium]